jgi:signal transduction histidine kinase
LLFILLVVNLIFFIPALIGGQLLARKAMEPVSNISRKLAKITSDNLDERVEIPRTGDELEELAKTFNNLFDRIAQAFSRERQFIGDVAHELKTPIATLRSGIELTISKARTNREYKKSLAETLVDTSRLSTTINNILDLAWLGAENTQFLDHQFDLSKTFVDLNEIAIKLATQKHLNIRVSLEPNTFVSGNEDKIARAILNLIDNAIKFTPAGGSVTLSLHQENDEAVIKIKDTGIGIGKNELPHVFERFYRGPKVAKTLGSGLGLAIAKGIVTAHRGRITLSSKVGKGTSVIIALPLHARNFMAHLH